MCGIRLPIRRAVDISERISDYITGHAQRTVGAKYGAPTVEDMAAAPEKFPRYDTSSNRL